MKTLILLLLLGSNFSGSFVQNKYLHVYINGIKDSNVLSRTKENRLTIKSSDLEIIELNSLSAEIVKTKDYYLIKPIKNYSRVNINFSEIKETETISLGTFSFEVEE